MSMNTLNNTHKNVMTLEKICQQKDEKLIEIRASKQRITETARQIFRPNESESKANTLMDNFNSGVAIFNGIMTGFKIIKRIRNYFYH